MGTQLAERGAKLHTIMSVLGHESPHMSMIYARISDAEVSAAERHQLVEGWNATASAYPRDKCVHELFAERAAETPDAVAAVYEDQELSYGELDRQSTINIWASAAGRSASLSDIANRYFAPSEVELLLKTPLLERPRAFARLWTLKEAYLKATGLGLNAQLETFAFQLEPLHVVFGPEISDRPEMWQFISVLVTSQHVLSIAVRQSGERRLPVMLREVCSADL